MNSKTYMALMALLLPVALYAQQRIIPIDTKSNSLVLQVDGAGNMKTIYFGAKLSDNSEYENVPQVYQESEEVSGILNSAYTSAGSRNLLEPAIAVTHADGNNSLDLKYLSHETKKITNDITLTSIILKDPAYDFMVTVNYKCYINNDVIEEWTEIKHTETGAVILQKFASANLYMKADGFWLNQYHGDWAREMQPEETKLTHGVKMLDTKLGTRENLFQPSVFMVSFNKPATENDGSVLFGALEYSGNFRTDLEIDYQNNLKIISGINNYASPYTLQPNELFITPKFLFTLSTQGKGNASRNLQRWARDYKLLDGNGSRLTLLNNWESTKFDFNEKMLRQLLKDTKKLGVDLFLLDDAWFGNKYPRNNDYSGLGDWQENKKKLPNGIASLIREGKQNGVKFGIWIEPEMVNPKSELYEKHPDWVVKQPKRAEYYYRNQLVLDLSNPDVQDFVYGIVDSIFTKYPDMAYIKWDCNAVIYNAYSAHLKNQNHFYIEYVRGLNSVLERIRAKYPKVPMMLCSGGGGRVDYSALQYFTEFWPSDNTDPIERVFMQWEYSYFYPAISSSNHVTNWGKESIKFKTDVAMMGKLGFDIPVAEMDKTDLDFCRSAVTCYNEIKQLVWSGEQYRLADPRKGNVASLLYIDQQQSSGVIFNYLVNYRFDEGSIYPILLKGLDPKKRYTLKEINLYPGVKSTIDSMKSYSGEFLMTIGFNPEVNLKRTSVVLQLQAVN